MAKAKKVDLKAITKANIIKACEYIDANGVPAQHEAKDYKVVYDGKDYPIKYLLSVAHSLQMGSMIADNVDFKSARDVLKENGFKIEPLNDYKLTITKDSVTSTDPRFDINNIGAGDKFKATWTYMEKSDGTIAYREKEPHENNISGQTMPRIAFQVFETEIEGLSSKDKEDFPTCQYTSTAPVIKGIFDSEKAIRAARNSDEILVYKKHSGGQFFIYCWNIFSTILFVQECLKRFGEEDDKVELFYQDKKDADAEGDSGMNEETGEDLSPTPSAPKTPNWENARNIILYGPPGTGKTYHTVIYAVAICEDKTVEKVAAEAYEEVLDRYNNTHKDQIEFVTFHQSYGYEEFIQGIKPSTDKGNVVYNVEDGIFKKFCDEAKGKDKKYVFIIDEINRGNVSKIFGELITLIENSKRISASDPNKGMKATLPYEKVDENGNKVKVEFGVPDNVYILGTMNTADRSLVQLDAALRRRFRFKEMMPKYADLNTNIDGINLADLLKAINKRISARIDREHQIGHSYFLKVNSFEDLKETFRYEIIPLLQEYFYDDYANIKEILKDDKDNKFISVEIVEDYENTKLYEIGDSAAWDEDAFKRIYK